MAAAIGLFGFQSGAALATVVGVLIEVPVMLSVVSDREQDQIMVRARAPRRLRLMLQSIAVTTSIFDLRWSADLLHQDPCLPIWKSVLPLRGTACRELRPSPNVVHVVNMRLCRS